MSGPPGSPFRDLPSHPPTDWTPPAYPPPNPNQTPTLLAVGSLVTGVISLLNCVCCLLIPVPFISIALGTIALTQKPDQSARVMAIIGIALRGLILVVFFGSMIYFAVNPASTNTPLFPINTPGE
jgi:hypothetical protein